MYVVAFLKRLSVLKCCVARPFHKNIRMLHYISQLPFLVTRTVICCHFLFALAYCVNLLLLCPVSSRLWLFLCPFSLTYGLHPSGLLMLSLVLWLFARGFCSREGSGSDCQCCLFLAPFPCHSWLYRDPL